MIKQINELHDKIDASLVELFTFQELLRSEQGAVPKRLEVSPDRKVV